jgi:hypothetical protein
MSRTTKTVLVIVALYIIVTVFLNVRAEFEIVR